MKRKNVSRITALGLCGTMLLSGAAGLTAHASEEEPLSFKVTTVYPYISVISLRRTPRFRKNGSNSARKNWEESLTLPSSTFTPAITQRNCR